MYCHSCGTQLPEAVAYCPACGALTLYRVFESGVGPYDPTALSSPSAAPLHAPPAPNHGYPLYEVPVQNPYEPPNPYAVPLQAPPPKRPLKTGLLLVAVVLVLILASS